MAATEQFPQIISMGWNTNTALNLIENYMSNKANQQHNLHNG